MDKIDFNKIPNLTPEQREELEKQMGRVERTKAPDAVPPINTVNEGVAEPAKKESETDKESRNASSPDRASNPVPVAASESTTEAQKTLEGVLNGDISMDDLTIQDPKDLMDAYLKKAA